MKRITTKIKKFDVFIILTVMISFVAIGIVSGAVLDKRLNENVDRRAASELNTFAKEQTWLLEHEMERQFISLGVLAAILSDDNPFAFEEHRNMMDILSKMQEWCTVGYADLEGNIIGYEGENPGNIQQESFFREIADGSADQKVEYLSAAYMNSEPRFLFSVPVYKDGEIVAVLFASKEVSAVEPILLSNNDAEKNISIFVIADNGTILCANSTGHRNIIGDNYYSACEQEGNKEGFPEEMLRTLIREEKSGSFTYNHRIISCSPTALNDWAIIVAANQKDLRVQYEANLKSVRKQVAVIMMAYGILILFVLVAASVFLRMLERAERGFQFEKIRNDIMMNDLGCELFTYDILTKVITTEGILHKEYGFDFEIPLDQLIIKQRPIHPECNFERIKNAVKRVIETGEKQELVFMLSFEKELRWIKLSLLSYSPSGREPTHIFGSFLNVSEEHEEFEKNAELLANMPGGFHRCYLSNPIHVEYVSQGLCDLLGYTREELDNIMVDGDYTLAIWEEDRDKFEEFANRLASKPGLEVCEYRMVRKDGSLISVSDTMESILTTTGIMYGYSVVYDISGFTNEIETLTNELEEAKIKNSLSQMQPHFLYNALASIREIVLIDPEYASELIVDFTTHLRACIKTMSSNDCIPFGHELENIKAYANIEKMRFGDKLNIEYNIDCDDFMVVPLSIQPIVENAIRHGIYERGTKGGTVSVSVYKDDCDHIIDVRDDGVGFDYEKMKEDVENGLRDSTGIANLIFRLEKMLGAKVEIMSALGCGTKVIVRIPIIGKDVSEENTNK